jgi:hypothetical protein
MRQEIEQALEQITQGEWQLTVDDDYIFLDIKDDDYTQMAQITIFDEGTEADAHFIANAPKWMRWLLAERDRLRELLAEALHDIPSSRITLLGKICEALKEGEE